MATRPQVPSLTGLRFAAALSVVLSHAVIKFMPFEGNPPLWHVMLGSLSGIGMSLFFVLSGFVIQYNYADPITQEPRRGTANFFIARFARLYPLYIIGLGFDLLNSYSYYQTSSHLGEALPYYLTMTQTWFYKLFGDKSLIYVFGPLPQVAWSISTEWFFYLAYPLILLVISPVLSIRALKWATALLICIALGVVTAIAVYRGAISVFALHAFGPVAADGDFSLFRWLIYFSPYSRIFEFILGCLTATIFVRVQRKVPNAREERLGLLLMAVALVWTAALYSIMFGFSQNSSARWAVFVGYFGSSFGLAPGLALLIFCCARYSNRLVGILSSTNIVLCGEASYSLYLLHFVVIERMGLGSPPPTNLRIGFGDGLRLTLSVLTCIGLSLVVWRLIEVPARKWLRSLLWIRARKDPLFKSSDSILMQTTGQLRLRSDMDAAPPLSEHPVAAAETFAPFRDKE